jgi:hypothetical protein
MGRDSGVRWNDEEKGNKKNRVRRTAVGAENVVRQAQLLTMDKSVDRVHGEVNRQNAQASQIFWKWLWQRISSPVTAAGIPDDRRNSSISQSQQSRTLS